MDTRAQIYELAKQGWGRTKIMRAVPSASEWLVRNVINEVRGRVVAASPRPVKESVTVIEALEGKIVDVPSANRILTPAELLEAAQVDPAEWSVEWIKISKSETTVVEGDQVVPLPLFHLKATLKHTTDGKLWKEFEDAAIAAIEARAPEYPAYVDGEYVDDDDVYLLELDFFDEHVGKLAWAPETGGSYDYKIARDRIRAALNDLLRKASGFRIGEILLPIGNDLFNADTPEGTTTAGTRQDTDTRPAKMFQVVEALVIEMIEQLMPVAPVRVVMVPGNHDEDNVFKLGRVLAAWFRNTDRVTVDAAPKLRKYVEYGVNLIGLTHGNEERIEELPLIMATEVPEQWARTQFREWHIGHKHRRKETKHVSVNEHKGVRVRELGSLTEADAWHYRKGYIGSVRCAECFLWGYRSGLVGNFSSNVHNAA